MFKIMGIEEKKIKKMIKKGVFNIKNDNYY